MEKSKWIWMPHAGHFILGHKCKFHLATYVGGYIVSTVGELWNERAVREINAECYDKKWFDENRMRRGDDFDSAYFKHFGWEELGYQRTYETMVFKAKKSDEACCPYVMDSGDNVDFDAYNDPKAARDGHMKLCNKWSRK